MRRAIGALRFRGEANGPRPELAVRSIQYSSLPGENVLDLFGGSGSTLIGCEQTGRRAFLMELDQAYCDVIVERWEKFTGRKAEQLQAKETLPAETAEKDDLTNEKKTPEAA